MNGKELDRQAAQCGLDLTPEQLAQLDRATALVRRLADLVPHDLPLEEEPALTFRAQRRARP